MSTIYEELRTSILGNDDLDPLPAEREPVIEQLRQIVAAPDRETRTYLQAWHHLRALGVDPPPDQVGVIRGVVAEVGLDHGTDVLAGYADHSARYFNAAGGAVFWDERRDDLDDLIDTYLDAGQAVADATGPYDEPLPAPAEAGTMAILLLTFGGIHLGTGDLEALMANPLGGAITSTALPLMEALVDLGVQGSPGT